MNMPRSANIPKVNNSPPRSMSRVAEYGLPYTRVTITATVAKHLSQAAMVSATTILPKPYRVRPVVA